MVVVRYKSSSKREFIDSDVHVKGNLSVQGAFSVRGPGNHAVISMFGQSSHELDFPEIAAGGDEELAVAVEGVNVGDPVLASNRMGFEGGLVLRAYASDVDEITLRLTNVTESPIDPALQWFDLLWLGIT